MSLMNGETNLAAPGGRIKMYPDNALAEFYPSWLIIEAEARFQTLTEIHAFASPIMRNMGWIDKGRKWCESQGIL
jgi:hypothetical protein